MQIENPFASPGLSVTDRPPNFGTEQSDVPASHRGAEGLEHAEAAASDRVQGVQSDLDTRFAAAEQQLQETAKRLDLLGGSHESESGGGVVVGIERYFAHLASAVGAFFKCLFGQESPTLAEGDPRVAAIAQRLKLEVSDLHELQALRLQCRDAQQHLEADKQQQTDAKLQAAESKSQQLETAGKAQEQAMASSSQAWIGALIHALETARSAGHVAESVPGEGRSHPQSEAHHAALHGDPRQIADAGSPLSSSSPFSASQGEGNTLPHSVSAEGEIPTAKPGPTAVPATADVSAAHIESALPQASGAAMPSENAASEAAVQSSPGSANGGSHVD